MPVNSKGKRSNTRKGFVSDKISGLAPSGIRRFFDLLTSMDGVISLGIGEPDFTTPWHIREQAIDSIKKGYTMYTSNSGMAELRNELASYLNQRYNVCYQADSEILLTVGVSEALDLAMRAVINAGDEVIMTDPCYVAYDACVTLADGVPVKVPTFEENSFEIEPEVIEKAITAKTRAILLGYPANPTGAVMSADKLYEIGEIARAHHVLVISDEIYSRLTYNGEHTCFPSLPGMKDNTLFLNGFSKAFAMTGWRLGYVAVKEHLAPLIEAMTKIQQYTFVCAPTPFQNAALAALDYDVSEYAATYKRKRDLLYEGLKNKFELTRPQGAFYAFAKAPQRYANATEFVEKAIANNVLIIPGNVFSERDTHFRISYATTDDKIRQGTDILCRLM